ncbi:MAG: class I tRNA ligase family protein [Planctomycetes bacterium]|nr:class I tRNA ligase family protein [Planctomycetota bacterium]
MDRAGIRYSDLKVYGEFRAAQNGFRKGDLVIVRTSRSIEYGEYICHIADSDQQKPGMKNQRLEGELLREASVDDRARLELLAQESSKDELRRCQELADRHKLKIDIVNIERLFGGDKILFYFVADGRVDFRELVRDLASEYKTRIEMKQIGIRDIAKLRGDAGPCGKTLCCNLFLKRFEPVTMAMAKNQKVTLEQNSISGMCGRLLCCLSYEDEMYTQLRSEMPKWGSVVSTSEMSGRVIGSNIMTSEVFVETADGERVAIKKNDITSVEERRKTDRGGPSEGPRPAQQVNEVFVAMPPLRDQPGNAGFGVASFLLLSDWIKKSSQKQQNTTAVNLATYFDFPEEGVGANPPEGRSFDDAFGGILGAMETEVTHKLKISDPKFLLYVNHVVDRLKQNQDLEEITYRGLMSPRIQRRLDENELDPSGACPVSKEAPENVDEKQLVFNVRKYEAAFKKFFSKTTALSPTAERDAVRERISSSLKNVPIARKIENALPKSTTFEGYAFTPWFLALCTYLYQMNENYDDDDARLSKLRSIYLIGRESLWSHTMVFPALLVALGLPLPTSIVCCGKGLIRLIDHRDLPAEEHSGGDDLPCTIENACKRFGADVVRYALLREVASPRKDTIGWTRFATRINNDIVGDFVNLIDRVASMIQKFSASAVPSPGKLTEADDKYVEMLSNVGPSVRKAFGGGLWYVALDRIWEGIRASVSYLEAAKPWAMMRSEENRDRVCTILYYAAEGIRILGHQIEPLMPRVASKIRRMFPIKSRLAPGTERDSLGLLEPGTPISYHGALIERVVPPSVTSSRMPKVDADDATDPDLEAEYPEDPDLEGDPDDVYREFSEDDAEDP